MMLVCLSHFTEVYSKSSGASLDGVYYFTMMAAPTFMLISGMLLGFFLQPGKMSLNSLSAITSNEEYLFLSSLDYLSLQRSF